MVSAAKKSYWKVLQSLSQQCHREGSTWEGGGGGYMGPNMARWLCKGCILASVKIGLYNNEGPECVCVWFYSDCSRNFDDFSKKCLI